MSHKNQAGRIILGDLKLFNQTVVFFQEELEPEIKSRVSETIIEWTKKRDWTASADSDDITDFWIAPPKWCFKDGKGYDNANPWFQINTLNQNASYRIADLFGAGLNSLSIWFYVAEKDLGFEGKMLGKSPFQSSPKNTKSTLNRLASCMMRRTSTSQ